jgi:zinc transport system substrate-binding protein
MFQIIEARMPPNVLARLPHRSPENARVQRLLLFLLFWIPLLATASPLQVMVSVLPIKTFVERVGGDHVQVSSLVQPGYSPATYDPTPQQIAALSEASLYVRVGVPFERAWMARIRAANPTMRILDLRKGIALRQLEEHTHADGEPDHHEPDHHEPDHQEHGHQEHGHQEQDPHIWTSPKLAIHMVGAIRDELSALDPTHRADYARNSAAYIERLRQLDRQIHALLDPLKQRRFMVFHPAWGYFADTYGLTQVAIEQDGKQPGARALVALIDQARHQKIHVIFVQPQFDRRQAARIASAIDGRVIAADPLAADYVRNLQRVAREFAGALQ